MKKICDQYIKLSDMECVAVLTKINQDQKADISIENNKSIS